jgi:hypothetical protein
VSPVKNPFAPSGSAGLALVAVALALAGPGTASADQILVNGDFELGNTAFTSGYRFSPGNILDLQTYDVVADPRLASPHAASYRDHTTGSGLMLAVNGAAVPDVTVWSQTVAVAPGTDYDFSAWASSWFQLSPARLDFLFNGVSIGTLTAPLTPGVWEEFRSTWNSGSDTALTIRIVNRNIDFSGNDFALDDLSLQGPPAQVIPEPTGLCLAALGAAGVLGYRRARGKRGRSPAPG